MMWPVNDQQRAEEDRAPERPGETEDSSTDMPAETEERTPEEAGYGYGV